MAKILVALDGSVASRSAVEAVRTFCPGADLVLFTVLSDPRDTPERVSSTLPWYWPGMPGPIPSKLAETREQAIDRMHAETIDRLESLAADLRKEGFTASCAVGFGDPAKEILAEAEQRQVDCIALASHGRSALGAALLGSVATALIHSHRFPVLVAPRAPD